MRLPWQAHIYVFSLLAHLDKSTLDPMNLDQWRFYILPTKILNERLPVQKQARLSRSLEIGAVPCDYHELKNAVNAAAAIAY